MMPQLSTKRTIKYKKMNKNPCPCGRNEFCQELSVPELKKFLNDESLGPKMGVPNVGALFFSNGTRYHSSTFYDVMGDTPSKTAVCDCEHTEPFFWVCDDNGHGACSKCIPPDMLKKLLAALKE